MHNLVVALIAMLLWELMDFQKHVYLLFRSFVSEPNASDRSSVFEGMRGALGDSHSGHIHGTGHRELPGLPSDTRMYDMADCKRIDGHKETSNSVHQFCELYICTDSILSVLSYAR